MLIDNTQETFAALLAEHLRSRIPVFCNVDNNVFTHIQYLLDMDKLEDEINSFAKVFSFGFAAAEYEHTKDQQ
jgi:hypothetical protein